MRTTVYLRHSHTGLRLWVAAIFLGWLSAQVAYGQTLDSARAALEGGTTLLESGRYQSAEVKLRQALQQFALLQADSLQVETRFLLDRLYDRTYQNVKRTNNLNQAKRMCGKTWSKAHRFAKRCIVLQADHLIDRGQSVRARALMEEHAASLPEERDPWVRAGFHWIVGRCRQKQYNLAGAEDAYRKATEIAEAGLPDTRQLYFSILSRSSKFYGEMGKFREAEAAVQKRLDYLDALPRKSKGDSLQYAMCYINLAEYTSLQSRNSTAIDYGDQAIALLNEVPEIPREFVGMALYYQFYSFAGYLGGKDMMNLALASTLEAEKYLRQPTDRRSAWALLQVYLQAIRFSGYTHFEENAVRIRKAKQVAEKWELDPQLIYVMAAGLENLKGNFDKALSYSWQSFQAFYEEYGIEDCTITNLGYSNDRTAWVHERRGDLDSALFYYQRSIQNFSRTFADDDLQQNPGIEHGYSAIYLVDALHHKSQCLRKKYRKEGSQDPELLKLAFITNQRGAEIAENIRQNIRGSESKLELSIRTRKQYAGVVYTGFRIYEATGDTSFLLLALQASEKAKNLLLLEQQNVAGSYNFAALPDSTRQYYDSLNNVLLWYQGALLNQQAYGTAPDSTQLYRLKSRIFQVKNLLTAWESGVRERYPNFYEPPVNHSDSLQTSGISQLLDPGEAFLEYFLGSEEIYAFLVQDGRLQVYRQPLPDDFARMTSGFIRTVRDYRFVMDSVARNYADFTDFGWRLYKILLSPILAEHPEISKLLIVPDGILNEIPFEALLTDSIADRAVDFQSLPYLIRDYRSSYAFSAATLLNAKADHRPNQNRLRCLAVSPDYESGTLSNTRGNIRQLRSGSEALQGAREEVRQMAEMGIEGEFLFGQAANEENFKALAPEFGLLHLAMHGQSDTASYARSNLRFSPAPEESREDQALYAYELAAMRLQAKLVVLSACETGVGKYIAGEGIMSLGREFIASGAQSVVMTLWKVEDQSSARLMGNFYRELVAGYPVDESLRRAKLQALQTSDSRTSHPYYWAGYVNWGASNAYQLAWENHWSFPVLATISGLLIVVLLGLLLRRKVISSQ